MGIRNLFQDEPPAAGMEEPRRHDRGFLYIIAAAALFVIGAAMRIFGAWAFEYSHTSDHGIICLMVKHILEGRELPVFFYGLPYMGSIEPLTSAALCRVFGMSGFWINMGTALWAIALLPVVFRWGRAAGGSAAGIAALVFCVVGPPDYFQFMSWADGGYASIVFFTTIILFTAARMSEMEADGRRCGHGWFLLLGLLAGLGWWQSPLLIPSFFVSALLLLAAMRGGVFTSRIFSGLAGFAAGSAPLWCWNFFNRWQTFDMLNMRDRPEFWRGLRLFYLKRIPDMLQFHRQPQFARVALAILLIALLAIVLVRLIAVLRRRNHKATPYIAAAFLFIVIYSALYGRSRFSTVNAPRYILVLVPMLAVLLGVAVSRLARVLPFGLAWLPLAAIVSLHVVKLDAPLRSRREARSFLPAAAQLADFMRTNGIRRAYTEYQPSRENRVNHAMNFLLNEEFVFSPHRRERYKPYAFEMELSREVAVMNNWYDFESFLAATGGRADVGRPAGITVHYNVKPSGVNYRTLAVNRIAAVTDGAGNDLAGHLLDVNFDTDWMNVAGKDAPAAIVVNFSMPVAMCGLRLLNIEGAGPGTTAVDAWDADAGQWKEIAATQTCSGYFWSGPRFYWGGPDFRLCRVFDPVETSRARIRLTNNRKGIAFRLREMQILEAGDAADGIPDDAALARLAGFIRERGITAVYADRWEANEMRIALPNSVQTSCLRGVFGKTVLPSDIESKSGTVVVVHRRDADLSRQALQLASVSAVETTVEPWRVFELNPGSGASKAKLVWCGFGCLPGRYGPEAREQPAVD